MSRIENVDGVVFVLYAFLVLYSSRFCFMEFVESSCAVFFEAMSQLPSLTVSEFCFFVQLGRPPFIWVQICCEVWLEGVGFCWAPIVLSCSLSSILFLLLLFRFGFLRLALAVGLSPLSILSRRRVLGWR